LENTNYALKCLSIPVVGDDIAETIIPLTWLILSIAVFINTLCLSLENTNYALKCLSIPVVGDEQKMDECEVN